jgi:NADH-quinone oxidoreductase subunit F
VYELPLGFPFKRMLEEVGGGVWKGRKLKAVVPGGSSTPVFNAEEALALNMDFDSVAKAGSFLGSGGVVVLDENTCIVKFALRVMKFYKHESCGWCVPCREGTNWLQLALGRFHDGLGRKTDIDLIREVSENILGRTFCPLGDAAAMPVISMVKKFRQEFEDHLAGRGCPYGERTEPLPHAAPPRPEPPGFGSPLPILGIRPEA